MFGFIELRTGRLPPMAAGFAPHVETGARRTAVHVQTA
jgi:hypothetical protein